MSRKPRNFSWIEEGKLAAFGWPSTVENLRYLVDVGIRHLVTLSPEKPPPIYTFPEIRWTEIKIREFYPPTISQINKFIEVCRRAFELGEAVGVHCWMGRGRTGTMVACYYVKYKGMQPLEAVSLIQKLRPGSVETYTQEMAVMEYYAYLSQNNLLEYN